MRPGSFPEFVRRGFYESCEDRLALTADPIADLLANDPIGSELSMHSEIAPNLIEAHRSTGLDQVRQDYGFRGGGQTVAVIDSGIAYDHEALGEGFGEGYRVVGGWDFTEENDANPYDDGPAGFHGTHVAGIIGSDDTRYTGVAPDVDLVALRVFNDNGEGYFEWVEKALQWVHEHRNDFENPITTVNLSLGTSWNADDAPGGAILEDEFAQLEADGIFISVSAGNSFQKFNQQAGLSYPAASEYVVPVASVDASGNLSSFSQRNERVLAAPGEYITSTVPDYIFGSDGVKNDFGATSGTSMAAPYVAGASVLLREAMEFVGYQNINQDMLFEHFWDTADIVHDSITGLDIHRINLENAFDALMPADEDSGGAHALGSITSGLTQQGLIGQLNDTDTYTFTAGQSGQATFTLSPADNMTAAWQAGSGQSVSGNDLQFQVTAGQSYTIRLAGNGSLSHYSFEAEIASTAIDLGAVDFDSFVDQAVSGQSLYQMTATSNGYFSVMAGWSSSQGSLQLQLYNQQNELLATVNSSTGSAQINALVSAGETVFLRVSGNAEVDLTAANLVGISGKQVTVQGTQAADTISLDLGANHALNVNGFAYQFSGSAVSQFVIHGSSGNDSINLTGSQGTDAAEINRGSLTLKGSGYQAVATSFENVLIRGGGGNDSVTLNGTASNDSFVARGTSAVMTGSGYSHVVKDFSNMSAYGNGGYDAARFNDTDGDDSYVARSTTAIMSGSDYTNVVRGFSRISAYAGEGHDMARFNDTAGNDTFVGNPSEGYMYGSGYFNSASGFERVTANARAGGYDIARMYDSAGDDILGATSEFSLLRGEDFYIYAGGFDRVNVFAINGGYDLARLYDSLGNDIFAGNSEHGAMYGTGYFNDAFGFDRVNAYSNSGYDVAHLYDSAGDDVYGGFHDYSYMYGAGYYNHLRGFARVNAYAFSGGNDVAVLYASQQTDTFVSTSDYSAQMGSTYKNYVRGFDLVTARGNSNDRAYFYDLGAQDSVTGQGNSLTRKLDGATVKYEGTGKLKFFAEEGFAADMSAVDYIYESVYQ